MRRILQLGLRDDPVSERFFVLSNLEANHPRPLGKPEMSRTPAGVLSSADLANWNVEKLFLCSPNLDDGKFGEGFPFGRVLSGRWTDRRGRERRFHHPKFRKTVD